MNLGHEAIPAGGRLPRSTPALGSSHGQLQGREWEITVTLLEAIAREEGFYIAGTRSQRNNNPGDIEYGKFAKAHGAVASDGRFARFPDALTGFGAMRALLRSGYLGLTLDAALEKWAPSSENNHAAYLRNVMLWTGLRGSVVVSEELLSQADSGVHWPPGSPKGHKSSQEALPGQEKAT